MIPLHEEASQALTISSKYENQAGLEYLYLGKHVQQNKHRFLIQFDLARIHGQAKLLSATLQLFLVNAGNNEDNLEHVLEAYPITSTEWHESNATSVVPWNKDYLGIDEDVDEKRYFTVVEFFSPHALWPQSLATSLMISQQLNVA